MSDIMKSVMRERQTTARVRAMDILDIVEEIHRLEDAQVALSEFAASWVRFVEATFAPVNADAGLRELDDDHELTITVEQFREFYEAARSAAQ